MKTNTLPSLIAEYRGTQIRSYDYVDRVTNARKTGVSVQHSLEATDEKGATAQLSATQIIPAGTGEELAAQLVKNRLQKGETYEFVFRSFEFAKGHGSGVLATINDI